MIDTVYRIVQTVINKENNGYITPLEFNLLSIQVQNEIFNDYFVDENSAKNKQNRGITNSGYSNLAFNQRQKMENFAAEATVTISTGKYNLPSNLYFLEDDGIVTNTGRVIAEAERMVIGYLTNSIATPSATYPIYERYSNFIKVMPSSITSPIMMRYIRKPKNPKWTYLPVGNPAVDFFNPAALDYQDFELHESEFTNIVIRLLSYLGVSIREEQVVQLAETLKDKENIKENG